MNDLGLIAAIRSGDQGAIALLYDRYSSTVYSVALRILGEAGSAEDVLQEVFIGLWRSPGIFDSTRGNLGAWLAVIARNRAIDVLRKRRPESEFLEFAVAGKSNFADEVERSDAIGKVREALASMPPAQRSALEMAYFQGLSHTEIASTLGEPLGTIKTRIRSGLSALRKTFA